MSLESGASGHVLVDVLDRVLDKGIVIDAAVRISVVGIELLGVDARVVVASIETYLLHADTLAYTDLAAGPRRAAPPPTAEELLASESLPAGAPSAESLPPAPPLYAEPALSPGEPAPETAPDSAGMVDPEPVPDERRSDGAEPPPDVAEPLEDT